LSNTTCSIHHCRRVSPSIPSSQPGLPHQVNALSPQVVLVPSTRGLHITAGRQNNHYQEDDVSHAGYRLESQYEFSLVTVIDRRCHMRLSPAILSSSEHIFIASRPQQYPSSSTELALSQHDRVSSIAKIKQSSIC